MILTVIIDFQCHLEVNTAGECEVKMPVGELPVEVGNGRR